MAGRYQLVKKLATGGMAEVFLARAAGPGGFEKSLVVKRILPQLAERESFVQMFFAEARIAAQLTHPNIVQIFDFGEDEGSYFIAMEYVDGVTLRAIAKWAPTNAPVSPLMAAKIIALAAEGLGWAHDYRHPETGQPLGIVHRDVSADNIMVSRTGAVKVLDFGVVRIDGEDHGTQAGALKGKVAYMPREQILGEALDGRVDVYALGVVLYSLLTGERPYEKPSEVALMHAILNEGPRPLTQFRQDVPEALVAIIERAMARSADGRFATCFELQDALEQFIASSGASVSTAQLGQLVARVREAQPGGEGKGTAGSRSGVGSAAGSSSGVRMATPPSQRGPASAPPPAVFDGPELGEEIPTNVDLAAIRAPGPVVDPFKTTPGMPAPAVLAELRARAAAADEGFALEPEPGTSPAAPQPISLETVPVMQALPKVGWWNERTPLSSPSAAGLLSTPSRGVEPSAATVVSPPRPSSPSGVGGPAAAAGGPATTPPRASSPSGVGGRSTPAGGLLGASGAPAAPPRASSASGSVGRPVMTPATATSVVDDEGLIVTTPSFAAERATTAPMEAVTRGPSITAAPPSPTPEPLDASHVTAPEIVLPPAEALAAAVPRASSPPPEGPAPRVDGAPAGPLSPPATVPMPPPGGGALARPSSPNPALGRAVAPPTLSPNASPPVPFSSRESGRIAAPPRPVSFRPGPPIAELPATLGCAPTRGQSLSVLSTVRNAVTTERSALLVRKFFPVAARLMEAAPDLMPWISWHASGVLSAALVSEEHAALARLVERVASAPHAGGRFGAWLRGELSSPRTWLHLCERLRRGLPSDAVALEQWIAGLGPSAAPMVMATIEFVESGPAQDLLCRALAAMVGDPAPVIAQLEAPNARHVAAWAHVLERCPSALDRKKIFGRVLAKRDVPTLLAVMTGRARAAGPETLAQLEAGLGDRSEEVRRRALELMAELNDPRVGRLLLPLFTDDQFDKRPDAERAALVQALANTKDPSAFLTIAEAFAEKSSLLNRKRLVQQRLPLVEGLGRATSEGARKQLEALVADAAQPDDVRDAARRALVRPTSSSTDRLTPEQTARLRRLVVLDLCSLVRAAMAVDAAGSLLEAALGRFREELRLLVMQEGRFELGVASDGVTVNGVPVPLSFGPVPVAQEVAQMLATCDLRSLRIDGPVQVSELRAALLQLCDPDGTNERAPHVQLTTFSGRIPQPVGPTSGIGDSGAKSAALAARALAFLKEQRDPVAVGKMPPIAAIDALLREWVALARLGAWRLLAVSAAPLGDRSVVHAVNTACIATAFAAELQLDAAAVREVAELSLFWTLSEVGLPAEAGRAAGEPLPEDFRLRLGLVFLSQLKHRRGPAAAVASFEAGMERPANPQVRGAGVTASILALAEAWDALALEDDRGHAAALDLLRSRFAHRFSPELLGLFLQWVEAQRA